MSKKKKKPRRKRLPYPSPATLAARAAGIGINENRRGTLMRLMDTAIHNWFFEGDPFVIHLLVCTSYMVLADLGLKTVLPSNRRSNELIASNNMNSLVVATKSTESSSMSGSACRRKS